MSYPIHPFADIFPEACLKDFQCLTHDILLHGLLEPIVLFDNQILDGRNRSLACRNSGVKPRYIEFEGDEEAALRYVVSKNLARRNLTTSQRALVAAKLADMDVGDNQHRKQGATNEATSQSKAAEKLNVSRSAVQRAAKVIESGDDELIAAVEKGDVSVSRAAKVAELPKEDRPEALSERAKSKGPSLRVVNSNLDKVIAFLEKHSLTKDEWERLKEYYESVVLVRCA